MIIIFSVTLYLAGVFFWSMLDMSLRDTLPNELEESDFVYVIFQASLWPVTLVVVVSGLIIHCLRS